MHTGREVLIWSGGGVGGGSKGRSFALGDMKASGGRQSRNVPGQR